MVDQDDHFVHYKGIQLFKSFIFKNNALLTRSFDDYLSNVKPKRSKIALAVINIAISMVMAMR